MFIELFKELRFALYAILYNIKNSAELRTSFIMNIIGMAINNTAFIIIWIFFTKSVGEINGWRAIDIVALQGFSAFAFGASFSIFYGIRKLPETVASGNFDRYLLSPKNLFLRTATSFFATSALGDLLFGIICIAVYVGLAKLTLAQILLLLVILFIISIIFLALITCIYSISFYFIETASICNGVFDIFMTPSLIPGSGFNGAARAFYTFVIPALCIGALPVEILKEVSIFGLFKLIFIALFWIIFSRFFFYHSVNKYESSNI